MRIRRKHRLFGGEGLRALMVAAGIVAIAALAFFTGAGTQTFRFFGMGVQHPNASASDQQTQNPQKYRVGSIVLFPRTGHVCQQRRFDNVSGRVVSAGTIDCGEVISREDAEGSASLRDNAARIRRIVKGFRR